MPQKAGKPPIAEIADRLKAAQGRFELLRLKEEITALLSSPEARNFSQADRDRLEDLLARLLAKEEQLRGCDPWRVILRPPLK